MNAQIGTEVGVLGIVTAPSEMVAKEVAKTLNPYLLHMPLTDDEEMPTFAFPFSPNEMNRGEIYEFCLNHAYDAIISAGLFTHGHVKTHAIRELIRVTRSGGYLCFTINEGVYHSQGFDKEIQSITDDKLWDIKKLEKDAYMTKEQVQAYYCLAQVH